MTLQLSNNLFDRFFDFDLWPALYRVERNKMSNAFDIDLEENDDSYVVSADIPGLDRENISVNYDNGYLTIKGVRESSSKNKEGNRYYFSERSFGSFTRSVRITNVNSEEIKAKYEDGVLTVNLPKRNQSSYKRITIE